MDFESRRLLCQSKSKHSNVIFLNLYPYSFNSHGDEVWDKVGQVVGNLQALESLSIFSRDRTHGLTHGDHDDDQVLPNPDWRELARILSQMRQKLNIDLGSHSDLWTAAEAHALARAIRGHPTITRFDIFATSPMNP